MAQGRGRGGSCVCPKCGHKGSHKRGVPCMETRCPQCNSVMFREGGEHHQQAVEKRAGK